MMMQHHDRTMTTTLPQQQPIRPRQMRRLRSTAESRRRPPSRLRILLLLLGAVLVVTLLDAVVLRDRQGGTTSTKGRRIRPNLLYDYADAFQSSTPNFYYYGGGGGGSRRVDSMMRRSFSLGTSSTTRSYGARRSASATRLLVAPTPDVQERSKELQGEADMVVVVGRDESERISDADVASDSPVSTVAGTVVVGLDDSAKAIVPTATMTTLDAVAVDKSTSSSKSSDGLGIWAARGLLLLVAAIWGTNFASVKYLEGLCFHPPCHHPASEFAFARFGVAALVSLPLLWKQNARVVLAGFECGLTITLGYISQAMALETIPSGECAFICSLTVVVVPLAAALLYGKPLELRHLAAAAVALLGVGILEGLIDVTSWFSLDGGSATATATAAITAATTSVASAATTSASTIAATASEAAGTVAEATTMAGIGLNAVTHSYGPLDAVAKALHVETGDLLALGQPLGFGYSFLRIEHYQEQFKNVPNRVLTIAAAQCVCVGILAALWMLSDYHFVIPSFGYLVEPHRIAVILWTGIVTTLLAIYLEGFALQTASATDASIAFSSEPVWASLFGFWLLQERLGIESYVGGTVIMAACLIGTLSDLKDKPAPHEEEASISSVLESSTASLEGTDAVVVVDDPNHAPPPA